MPAYVTDLYVASQTARELVVVDPSNKGFGISCMIAGLLFLVIGFGALSYMRIALMRPVHFMLWLIPIVGGAPFVVIGLVSMVNTKIILSADAGALSVQKTLLSMPMKTTEYPLEQVRLVKVGVGDVCRFLYVSLGDRPAKNLTGCTDRTGYSEVADAMNAFLNANRR